MGKSISNNRNKQFFRVVWMNLLLATVMCWAIESLIFSLGINPFGFVRFVIFVLFMVFIFIILRKKRYDIDDGRMKFSSAYLIGLLLNLVLVSIDISAIYFFLNLAGDKYMVALIESMKEYVVSNPQLYPNGTEQVLKEIENTTIPSKTIDTFYKSMFSGFLYVLLIAVILKK